MEDKQKTTEQNKREEKWKAKRRSSPETTLTICENYVYRKCNKKEMARLT